MTNNRFEHKTINRRGEEIFLIHDKNLNRTQFIEFPARGVREITVVEGSLERTESTLCNIGWFVEGEVISNIVEFDGKIESIF
jgi:hypothetical protein